MPSFEKPVKDHCGGVLPLCCCPLLEVPFSLTLATLCSLLSVLNLSKASGLHGVQDKKDHSDKDQARKYSSKAAHQQFGKHAAHGINV
eukprot:1148297-Pelagomonas_calceolata.AAC.1